MNSLIRENRYTSNLNYILEDENIFYDVGYKVLQSQINNGFIKCTRVMHNGKIKLVYDISKYKDIESEIRFNNIETFLRIISNLLKVAIGIKENGFIEHKNINTSLKSIFVDTNNLNIFLIYLPISIQDGGDERAFRENLKQNILSCIEKNPHLGGIVVTNLRVILSSDKSLEEIYDDINSYKTRNFERDNSAELRNTNIQTYTDNNDKPHQNNKPVMQPVQQEKKKNSSVFGNIFSKKSKSKDKNYPTYDNTNYDEEDENDFYEETGVLDEEQEKNISLICTNHSEKFEININKYELVIGSKREYADVVINFNKAISRRHCKINRKGNKYYLVDLGSSNGTYLNGRRLSTNESSEINVGDNVKIANSEFKVI